MSTNQHGKLELALPAWPASNFSEFGETESVPLNRIQSLTASFLSRNSLLIPHVTHHDDVDITTADAGRKGLVSPNGDKVTMLAVFIKRTAALLAEFPRFNASLDAAGQQLTLKKYFHVGVAVDTPSGLLVPVLRDCDKKSVQEIAAELVLVSKRAREKGLPMKDMVGGCITISSLGHIGGTAFTPLITAPEVAIIGLTRARLQPQRGVGDGILWRLMQPVSLSYDHRVINGADAARFTVALGSGLDAIVHQ